MKKRLSVLLLAMMLLLQGACAEGNRSTLTADSQQTGIEMSDTLYGLFFEDINHAADGGIYAELLQNRSFEYEDILNPREFDHLTGWAFNMAANTTGKVQVQTESPLNENNTTYITVECQKGDYRFANVGYGAGTFTGGVTITGGKTYNASVYMRSAGFDGTVEMALTERTGKNIAVPHRFTLTDEWQKYEWTFTPEEDCDAVLSFIMHGTGSVDFDMASLMPADAVNGCLRGDLVEALQALHPRFLRFPGGCVAEGSYYRSNFYNWKDTVGPVEQRKENFNTWGYMQSYGLGFYEYFCLAETIGALPLPVVHAGLLCQARDVKEAPLTMAELEEYAQDILDLVEFATGDVDTTWGALRAEMGHPEPFDLQYLAIGNENWDSIYFDRYAVLSARVKEKYPDLTLVVSAGPVAEGGLIQASWNTIRAKFADSLVDEHYYMDSDWFLNNVHRYDSYPRTTSVFLGEYAAHEAAVGSKRPNNLYSALCEAAYMTGLERNSDVVKMACYAPLFARDGMYQWSPDLIWFNAREVMLTPNYYVQQMFASTLGDYVLESSHDTINQRIYHVVTRTDEKLFVKLVNVSEYEEEITLSLSNVSEQTAEYTMLTGDKKVTNTFLRKENCAPEQGTCVLQDGTATVTLPAYAVMILTFDLP